MPYWDRPAYPPYSYYPPNHGYSYIDRPAKHAVPAHPYYVYAYPTYIPFNVNYGNPVIPSDYADLLEVALATNLSKLTVRFNLSMDELYHHYRLLRGGVAQLPHMCRQRCQELYQQCLRFAVNDHQRRQCYDLYQRCLAWCPQQ